MLVCVYCAEFMLFVSDSQFHCASFSLMGAFYSVFLCINVYGFLCLNHVLSVQCDFRATTLIKSSTHCISIVDVCVLCALYLCYCVYIVHLFMCHLSLVIHFINKKKKIGACCWCIEINLCALKNQSS